MISLGIDIGSSSVKVALLDIATGKAVASATTPAGHEQPITAHRSGWAEQAADMWWENALAALKEAMSAADVAAEDISCIGITYQMHGLVVVDEVGQPLRDSIIWCDSRAVGIGAEAMAAIGRKRTLEHLLNSPGNFTASKLRWVLENEPELFSRMSKFMLPGDYIFYKLTGRAATTVSGLSEQILWDYKEGGLAKMITSLYEIPETAIPEYTESITVQGHVSAEAARITGLAEGTTISYRAGDQPNNAFSLNVLDGGEIAATGGTSGVIYGVAERPIYDPLSRINTFIHVNHRADNPRYGVLLCINGIGIANSWMRHNMAPDLSYDGINALCETVPVGSDGVLVLPFGNGAERMLENRYTGLCVENLDLNRHTRANVLRATQEGIAFSFRYGLDIMRECGISPSVIRAGRANMFQSAVFRQTLADVCDVQIELYNTDGALGSARGAAMGAGLSGSRNETFQSLEVVDRTTPSAENKEAVEAAYHKWAELLEAKLGE